MKNIVLIGFMGTGKTVTGRLLAARLARPFIDMDKKIELETNMSIPEIFAKHGENYFRRIESAMVSRLSRYTNFIISTGGGMVLNKLNVIRFRKRSILIRLTADVHAIVQRTGKRRIDRPLLNVEEPEDAIANLLKSREATYRYAADYTIDTTGLSPHQVTEDILKILREGGYLRGRG